MAEMTADVAKAMLVFCDAQRALFETLLREGKAPTEAASMVKRATDLGGTYLKVEHESKRAKWR